MKKRNKQRTGPHRLLRASHISFLAALAMSVSPSATEYNGPAITFEQIYANPDDQALNLNYARQQAAIGDYLHAAASLERMLYSQPNWDSARLFYALCLYHLDDLQAATRELDILQTRPLTPSQRGLLNDYRKMVAK